jgi:predicted RND superfamily exporter protein
MTKGAMKALARALVVLVTAACFWASMTRLQVSPDLSALFPSGSASAALARYARVFGGGDLALVLVRATSADEAEEAAADVARTLAGRPSVAHAIDRAPAPDPPDPTLAWIYAGPAARARLEQALSPEGMRARLQETRALVLAPGAAAIEPIVERDPLRLAQIPFEANAELAAGVAAARGDPFSADNGRARLVLVVARGNAFESRAAAALVEDAETAFAEVRARRPNVQLGLTGGHAVARATEALLRRDLTLSGLVSVALAAIAFMATFRRARALLAVLPPLALGTIWTTAVAALAYRGLSPIAVAFASVVVGVGVDTGVHVYGALLDARRAGMGPTAAADHARRVTWRPTLLAAAVAGAAFAALALSDVAGVAQLGVLCGLGEISTAIAILLVAPEVGAFLERGAPPPAPRDGWIVAVRSLTATRLRAGVALGACALAFLTIGLVGWPRPSGQLVAIRPRGLAPLVTSEEVYHLFGGRAGQWIVLSVDRERDRAAARADAIAEGLEPLVASRVIEGFDALAPYAPAPATQRARLAARDGLDLPRRGAELARALAETGFDIDACAPALAAFAAPSHALAPIPDAWVVARHLQDDAGETIAVTHVRPRGDPAEDARALRAIYRADPDAIVTGYEKLEDDLRVSLTRDLPRVALLALVLVAIGLRAALGGMRDVLIALGALAAEIAALGLAMRGLGVRWHIYDALVVPVLLGLTIDESMFLLHAARARARGADLGADDALRAQGPRVAATALTTAAGFAALLVCRFDGLHDLGAVGALGTLVGLAAALVVVPACLRLAGGAVSDPK